MTNYFIYCLFYFFILFIPLAYCSHDRQWQRAAGVRELLNITPHSLGTYRCHMSAGGAVRRGSSLRSADVCGWGSRCGPVRRPWSWCRRERQCHAQDRHCFWDSGWATLRQKHASFHLLWRWKGRANGFKQVYLQRLATPNAVLPTGR